MRMSLPDEIITNNILSNLPVKSIKRFRSVSKTWCSLFSDPYFIKLHHNHALQQDKFSLFLINYSYGIYSINYDSLVSNNSLTLDDHPFIYLKPQILFLDSCNGLISFFHHPKDEDNNISKIYLWNPSTDECRVVHYQPPPPPPPHDTSIILNGKFDVISWAFGFGYDSKHDEYKILMIKTILDYHHGSVNNTCELYTLGSDSWKISNNNLPNNVIRHGSGVFVNGALHWMATPFNEGFLYHIIVSFDVVEERFEQLPVQQVLNHFFSTPWACTLGVLGDCLCILVDAYTTQVWIMKEYGVSDSWTKLFTFPQSICFLRPMTSFKNGDILLQGDGKKVVLYDKKKKTTIPKLSGIPHGFEAVTCVESLVSLNSRIYLKQELDKEN